jgi:hypothetical protein
VKRAIIFGVYAAIAIADHAVLGMSAALGQESIHVKNLPGLQSTTGQPLLEQLARQSAAKTAEIAKVLPQYAIIREAAPGKPPDPVVITWGQGGRVDEHRQRFAGYKRTKAKVEIRGPCYSACTLLLSYVAADDLCIAPGGFMAFHAIRSMEKGERMNFETWQAYLGMPLVIKMWIDDNGGHENLPLNGYWTLRDHQLWAMGYPKCQ